MIASVASRTRLSGLRFRPDFRWRGVGPPTEFVGLNNYVLAFQDPIFIDALRNNAISVFGSLLIQGPIALGVALLLNRNFRGRTLFRLLAFVPYVLAEVTVGIMWKLLLSDAGTVNAMLESLGLGSLVQAWLADLDIVIWTMLAVLTWKYVGFAIILLLAGLSNVPQELNEAAAIDGASWWQIQRHITIPLLKPTIFVALIFRTLDALQKKFGKNVVPIQLPIGAEDKFVGVVDLDWESPVDRVILE